MAKRKKGTVTGLGTGTISKPGGNPVAGVPKPAAQGPLAPQNPYVSGSPPIDPAYEAYKVSAGRNVALADSDATYNTAQIENSYGLGSDTSNPWSQAKLLQTNWQRSQRATLNSAGNQLYSGSHQRAQAENTRDYEMGYDQLSRNYSADKRGVTRGQLGTYAGNVTGVDSANFDSILRGI